MAKIIRRPKKAPDTITITFFLQGKTEEERISEYMFYKAEEMTTLSAMAQAWFQCESSGRTAEEFAERYDGILTAEDFPWLEQRPTPRALDGAKAAKK